MENLLGVGGDDNRSLKQFMSQFDAPAYVRRARQVQEAYEQLLGRCRKQRDEWLTMVRIRLGTLHALTGEWDRLVPLLADKDQLEILQQLFEHLRPQLRVPIEPTKSLRTLRIALRELRESMERFNRRWREFLPSVDLTRLNELRDGYNRYFLLEKECAVRSVRVATLGYRPLEPFTLDELTALLPPLPVPRIK